MNSRNKTKMVEHNLVSFATIVALWTNAIMAAVLQKRSYFQERFVWVSRAGVFIQVKTHDWKRNLSSMIFIGNQMVYL